MKHDRWLNWKIEHGLAIRGRGSDIPLAPKGIAANLVHKMFFKKQQQQDVTPVGGRVFKQPVGGTLGPSGDMK